MKAFWEKHKKALLRGLLVLLVLWAVWYARPVDIHFLLGNAAPDRTSMLVIDCTSPYSRQSRNLDPEDDPEAAALTAEVLAELEGLRFHRSPLEPLLRVLPPMGGGSIRHGEDGKKEYDIYFYFYDIRSEEDWDPPWACSAGLTAGPMGPTSISPSTSPTATRPAGSWGPPCGNPPSPVIPNRNILCIKSCL